ncbi:MAG TPA: VOC family protein [Ktedonobacterales bacterium]|nr:VOC family protein [Ktedonobacterales bacterium]
MEFAMVQTPYGQMSLELIKFHAPPSEQETQYPLANALGIRHIAFVVEDIDAVVATLQSKGIEPFGEVQNFENIFLIVLRSRARGHYFRVVRSDWIDE